MRRLGLVALGAVILQGLLGGLTVLLLLPAPVSIGHAGLAQLFFCLTISLALFTSPRLAQPRRHPVDDPTAAADRGHDDGVIYVQILLGATMRHTGAGLAIPDFPLAFGGLLPPAWTARDRHPLRSSRRGAGRRWRDPRDSHSRLETARGRREL